MEKNVLKSTNFKTLMMMDSFKRKYSLPAG